LVRARLVHGSVLDKSIACVEPEASGRA
jgi:hypothetical protein